MERTVKMPKLSGNMKKGILVAWIKNQGDAVKKGDILFEVETEKVISEIESLEDGIIKKTFYNEGDEVNVNDVVAMIEV